VAGATATPRVGCMVSSTTPASRLSARPVDLDAEAGPERLDDPGGLSLQRHGLRCTQPATLPHQGSRVSMAGLRPGGVPDSGSAADLSRWRSAGAVVDKVERAQLGAGADADRNRVVSVSARPKAARSALAWGTGSRPNRSGLAAAAGAGPRPARQDGPHGPLLKGGAAGGAPRGVHTAWGSGWGQGPVSEVAVGRGRLVPQRGRLDCQAPLA
jgi:hypothetical protein